MSSRSSFLSNRFPSLISANFQPLNSDGEIEVNYKSGASFKGQVQGHIKIGRGIFTWPNGARYEGEYSDNVRHGEGVQYWPDGSSYKGQFMKDLRHGDGEHTWANREAYKGRFFQDRRHGKGEYTWPDGSSYKGSVYMDKKEGFGVFLFANGNRFEGLYKDDEREGPGILTHPAENQQDVGIWHGEKLIKICSAIPGAFCMRDHKEFEFNADEHIQYLDTGDPSSWENYENILKEVKNGYEPDNGITEKVSSIFNIVLDSRSLAVNKEAFDREFYQSDNNETIEKHEKVKLWNRTPAIIAVQKHYHKHMWNKSCLTYNTDQIISGSRGKFLDKGPLEIASEELIKASTEGNVNKVEDLLASGKVSPDVADQNGHTPLIGASVNWHIDVINCLLNHGANVNKLNDEGCSALSAGSIFFYPIDSFKFNIAERYLKGSHNDNVVNQKEEKSKKNQQQQQQQNTSQGTPRSILSKKQTVLKKSASNQSVETIGSNTNLDTVGTNLNARTQKQQVRIDDSAPNHVNVLTQEDLSEKEEFDSTLSLKYFEIEVTENLIERCATQLSSNERIVSGRRGNDSADLGRVRHLAVIKNERERMKATLDLLLQRGADPNSSGTPMPVLFFAIKAADVDMVKALLSKGASTSIILQKEKGSLAPLHIACAIPGEEGVQITELMLQAGANPDVRAVTDYSFLNDTLIDEWSKDKIPEESQELLGGRTPLHIACARDEDYKSSTRVIRLLLEHRANTNLLCNGFSPLALCIASGNDLGIDELLLFGNDVSLPLTHGVGSALCAATNTEYEYRRSISGRLQLIDKLVKAGGNILAPIAIGPKRLIGTAVDYAYYMFYQDNHIAKTPYHALTHAERETFINRRKLLEHVGDILRGKAVEREKRRLDDEQRDGVRSASPSSAFVYIGAGAPLPADAKKPKFLRGQQQGGGDGPMVKFEGPIDGSTPAQLTEDGDKRSPSLSTLQTMSMPTFTKYVRTNPHAPRVRYIKKKKSANARKPLFKYCYQCGRSVFVRLAACTRCKEVYYCSKACKLKAWNARHKEECIRIGGRSRSPSPRRQGADSPTPATHPDKGKKATVAELSKDQGRLHRPEDDVESLGGMLQELGFDIDKTDEITISLPGSRQTSARTQTSTIQRQTRSHGSPSRHTISVNSNKTSLRGRPVSSVKGLSKGSSKGSSEKDKAQTQYMDNYSYV